MEKFQILNELDTYFLEMANDKNILYKTFLKMKDFFINENLFNICLQATKHPFFTESENNYHNGLHTARVLESIKVLTSNEQDLDLKNIHLLIVAGLFHDFLHEGRTNKKFAEQESKSVDEFKEYIVKFKVLTDDEIKVIEEIILHTEVSVLVKQALNTYQEEKDGEKSQLVIMQALMCEADILSSVTHNCGVENGLLLAKEFGVETFGTTKGRLMFLNHACFVTKASKKLNIQEYIENEKNIIQKKKGMKL